MNRMIPFALGLVITLAALPSPAEDASWFPGVAAASKPLRLPIGVRRIADIPYGDDRRQRFDVYVPESPVAQHAPILVMVHGGAWMFGDKAMPQVVENKAARWVTHGAILVSINYRMVPQVTPLDEADDVAHAIAAVQRLAPSWGGDPTRLALIGHSAGAHLVALVTASPTFAKNAGAQPWRGTVVLDSAALDTVGLMKRRHARFYDRVFGADPATWSAASPTAAMSPHAPPMLLVCSTQRTDGSCQQSQAFASQAQAIGAKASVLPQDLSHLEINATLGQPGVETDAVQAFFDDIGLGAR